MIDELYDEIASEINRRLRTDQTIKRIQKKVDKGTATHAETEAYAKRLGEITSKALQDVLTEDNLPDGEMYYNVTKGTVGKVLKDNLTRVNALGEEVQLGLNISAGLGLMALGAKMNSERLQALCDDIYHCGELEEARELMGEPIVNMTQTYADDLIKENADFQYNTGMNPKIIRTASAGCCEWCAELEGEYDYPVEDPAVYQRHEYCSCVITFHPNKSSFQNVTTRREYRDAASLASRQAQIEARRNYGL